MKTQTAEEREAQCLRYAEEIAVGLIRKWYPEATQWKPLTGDLFGLLMQIDNTCTGLARKGTF